MNYQSSQYREGVTRVCPVCGHEKQRAPVEIDFTRSVAVLGDWQLRLTLTEAKILHALARTFPHVCPYERIAEGVWGYRITMIDGPAEMIKVVVCRLRKRLAAHGAPFAIKTTHGSGYWLEMR